ncbi:MAG: hypothetical protein CYPHOPRED_001136 [Cyphobasidiales sp. Tagirdzhanova-0007]|nr:MAG: hypothetical protein CYPHOPRED_001136 [Cyphobasidiales sp. Tagirdzhanova-0007]
MGIGNLPTRFVAVAVESYGWSHRTTVRCFLPSTQLHLQSTTIYLSHVTTTSCRLQEGAARREAMHSLQREDAGLRGRPRRLLGYVLAGQNEMRRSHTAIERLPVLGEEGRNDPAFSELGRDAEPAVQVASTAPVRLSQNGCTSSRPSQFRTGTKRPTAEAGFLHAPRNPKRVTVVDALAQASGCSDALLKGQGRILCPYGRSPAPHLNGRYSSRCARLAGLPKAGRALRRIQKRRCKTAGRFERWAEPENSHAAGSPIDRRIQKLEAELARAKKELEQMRIDWAI